LDQHQSKPKKKHHEKFHKTQQKIISRQHLGKTCKPPQHHLGIPDTHFIRKTNHEIGDDKKKEHQQNRMENHEQVMSAGSGKGNANPHNHRETPTEDRTGDDTLGHGGNLLFFLDPMYSRKCTPDSLFQPESQNLCFCFTP